MKRKLIGLIAVVIAIAGLSVWGYFRSQRGSVDIPDNVVDPEAPVVTPEANLELITENENENLPFNMLGIEDGDKASIRYRVKVSHNSSFTLKYDFTVRDNEHFERLAEILSVKVELLGKDGAALYEGLLVDMPTIEIPLTAAQSATRELLFRVTAYLNTPLEEG